MKNLIKSIIAALCLAGFVSCHSFDTPSSVSYTLISSFDGLVDDGSLMYFQDSLVYAQIFAMDQVVYLSTKCGEDINTDFKGGWKISIKKGGPDEPIELSRFASAGPDAGSGGSKAYAAFFYSPGLMPEYDIRYSTSNYSKFSATISGLFINNTKAVEMLCLGGEVEQGDFLKVIAHEYLSGTETGTEEFMLVDYTGSELKYVNEWKPWEFENKPGVDNLKFEVVASSGKFPLGFCMDNFVTSIAIEY